MRPHRLSLTAFGSFPGTESVSFDDLAEAGLFLVHGPTGAGKTTVLDAICFALYGQVPGQRNSARSLRCDHAAPSAGPSVELEVTIRGRLFRIERAPAWQRPKLRGTGSTEEKARVIVQERTGSQWRGLTTRADEAGDLIGGLLGMNADQFCQVAMLPQGDFARFLRADGDDRRKLLERLFTVKVFTQTEAWLAEHRKQTWREALDQRQEVDFAIKRLEEAAGDDLLAAVAAPEPVSGDALFDLPPRGEVVAAGASGAEVATGASGAEVASGAQAGSVQAPTAESDPLGWAGALLAAARAVAARSARVFASGESAFREATARLDRASALAERQRRHAEALTLRRALDERAEERSDLLTILDEAARADRVRPLIAGALQRAEGAAKSRRLAADAVARARPLLPGDEAPSLRGPDHPGAPRRPGLEVDPELLATLERARRGESARLSELLTEEARLSVVHRDLGRIGTELAGLITEEGRVTARLGELPGLIEGVESRLAKVRADAAGVPAAEAIRATAADLLGVERDLTGLDADLRHLAEREAQAAEASAELPALLTDAATRLTGVRAEAARVPTAQAAHDAARLRVDTARRRDALTVELDAARRTLQEATDRAQEAREHWLDLRQARVEGMAAELAQRLAEGEPCAVCGSPDHPAPAAPALTAPSPDDERVAEAANDRAATSRGSAQDAVTTIESRLAEVAEAIGDLTVDQAQSDLTSAARELAALRERAGRERSVVEEVDRLEAARDRARQQDRELGEQRAGQLTRRTQLHAERTRLLTRLHDAAHPADAAAPVDAAGSGDAAVPAEAATPADALSGAELRGDGLQEVATGVLLARVEADLVALRASAAREPSLAVEAATLHRERADLEEQARRVTARLAACRTRKEELEGDVGRLTERLDAARGQDRTLAARLGRLADEAELLGEAHAATLAAAGAESERGKAVEAATAAAHAEGFGGVEDAQAAVRDPADRDEKDRLLRELDAQHAAVSRMLADPELVAAAAEPEPDLPVLEAAREEAEHGHTALASARDRDASRQRRVEELHAELAACLDRWLPAAARHKLAERLAALASGMSGDNQWSMSLSSYVLGERLRQVVDAANQRLDHMSGGRYQLRHDMGKTAGSRGRAGGGLGLRVVDGWTGVDRDPATLSGGESFIASLALALGLADVVTEEAGGAEIGTLFVDEGFGTLDEDTLDSVLDILDGLRDGGRAVGIVSHVAELRTRIPAQLKVAKARTGSTLSVVVPA